MGICRDITERKKAEEALKKSKEETEKQNWLKTGLTELNDKMRGEQDAVHLTQNIITYLAERLNLQIGAVYLAENGALKLTGSYAYSKGKNLANEFTVGEGLVGQAALEKKSVLVTDLPEDYIRIQSGLGEAPPRNILVAPFLYEGNVMGVIELGSVHTIPDDHMKFLNQALDNIAINLNSAQSRTRQRELLEETQVQTEELTAQTEELTAAGRTETATGGITADKPRPAKTNPNSGGAKERYREKESNDKTKGQ
ncbi:MAG: GAF domain-containing protein [Nitrospinae bacterium]|nr:GAF domain-containing protein [Nitrospinota bacterium]